MLSGSIDVKMKSHLGNDLAEHDPGEDAPDGAGEGEDDGVHLGAARRLQLRPEADGLVVLHPEHQLVGPPALHSLQSL